ncbi:MAG: response regulator [Archaeoglobi archaeon]|jgi:CheY-like chemotaxis protein|nr:response regulator [Archaeoglobus sp.]NHW88208.1 response regulator [Archaeoglobales archaeon]TDA27309.1 MAG: response regulator [Archaeoglobi archaeon]TDA28586.1 MAG: response regulator [Archaeoglobi archaeon]
MKILIVEDDESMIELLKKILCQYEVIVAKDGKEGVEKFLAEKPDLVLMDIELPKMNGIDATKEIKKIDPNAKIIAVTAYAVQRGNEAMKVGILEIISKPFKIKNLIEKVESALKV